VLFLLVAPGVIAGVIPWCITGWQTRTGALDSLLPSAAGATLIVVGGGVLLNAFARFALEGRGTPAPIAPTERLVVGGAYRFVRNPMYIAVAATILGQALVLDQPSLYLYAAAFGVTVSMFVRYYEQPKLHEQYGTQYEQYCDNVRAWIPRLRAWQPKPTPR
jgi:protein-S-isoprenylcysteine O-methyltransferase Ste14